MSPHSRVSVRRIDFPEQKANGVFYRGNLCPTLLRLRSRICRSYPNAPSYGQSQRQTLRPEQRHEDRAVHQQLKDQQRAVQHELKDANAGRHYGNGRW